MTSQKSTYLYPFDEKIFRPENLILMYGDSGSGKTTCAVEWANRLYLKGFNVQYRHIGGHTNGLCKNIHNPIETKSFTRANPLPTSNTLNSFDVSFF